MIKKRFNKLCGYLGYIFYYFTKITACIFVNLKSVKHSEYLFYRRISDYKNKYKKKRCFILGNGPSLNKTDLKVLKDEYTFGLNRIFLNFKKMGFETTFLVTVNPLVAKQSATDLETLKMPIFVSSRAKKYIKSKDNIVSLKTGGDLKFTKDITEKVSEGATVTFVAMQIAYYMGFDEVILVGVDHSFKDKGKPGKVVVSGGDDLNHFSKNYFGKGFAWQLPDLEVSEAAYRLAKIAFEKDGRKIVDATVDGKLNVFPKVKYQSLF